MPTYVFLFVLVNGMASGWKRNPKTLNRTGEEGANRCLSPCIVTFYWRPRNRRRAAKTMLINGPMAAGPAADAELMA